VLTTSNAAEKSSGACAGGGGLYKIFFYFLSFVHESIVPFFRPVCIAHTVAIQLHGYGAIYDPPSTSLLYATHHTILVITIFCKGRGGGGQEASSLIYPLQDIVSLQSFIVGVHHPFIAPPHLQSLPYCNTIARPFRNIRPPTDPPFGCHAPYHIGDGNIV